jgi:hypothetical protein
VGVPSLTAPLDWSRPASSPASDLSQKASQPGRSPRLGGAAGPGRSASGTMMYVPSRPVPRGNARDMNARFRHQSARQDGAAGQPASGGFGPGSSAILTDRSCCCPARPVVRVIMPPTQTRPWKTDLLLCGHHYRVSRGSLAPATPLCARSPGRRARPRPGSNSAGTTHSSRPRRPADQRPPGRSPVPGWLIVARREAARSRGQYRCGTGATKPTLAARGATWHSERRDHPYGRIWL